MLVFFCRYIILAKHHFATFFFGFFVLECIIFYLSFSWLVFLFLSLSFCTQLCFLSTACIILQLNFGFFQSVLKDICELTEGVTLRVHVPAPPQTERMSVGSTRQRASASFIIIILSEQPWRVCIPRFWLLVPPHGGRGVWEIPRYLVPLKQ